MKPTTMIRTICSGAFIFHLGALMLLWWQDQLVVSLRSMTIQGGVSLLYIAVVLSTYPEKYGRLSRIVTGLAIVLIGVAATLTIWDR